MRSACGNGSVLADVFACFNYGVSVDLVSTSETNVTASFDQKAAVVAEETLQALLVDLREHCEATLLRDCASVSLLAVTLGRSFTNSDLHYRYLNRRRFTCFVRLRAT